MQHSGLGLCIMRKWIWKMLLSRSTLYTQLTIPCISAYISKFNRALCIPPVSALYGIATWFICIGMFILPLFATLKYHCYIICTIIHRNGYLVSQRSPIWTPSNGFNWTKKQMSIFMAWNLLAIESFPPQWILIQHALFTQT